MVKVIEKTRVEEAYKTAIDLGYEIYRDIPLPNFKMIVFRKGIDDLCELEIQLFSDGVALFTINLKRVFLGEEIDLEKLKQAFRRLQNHYEVIE